MKKCFQYVFLVCLILLFSACSSSQQLNYSSNHVSDLKISKEVCTSSTNLSLFSSLELKDILLEEAKQEILFDFLNNNSIFTTAYTNVNIKDKINIVSENFEMTDDFRYYCLKVNATIEDTDIIYDEIVLQKYISNYSKKSL